MKKSLSTLIGSSLMAAGIAISSSAFAPANAVPNLQVDILGGSYDNADESVFTTNNSFNVSAYCDPSNQNNCLSKQHFLSIAILDANGDSVTTGADFGSFTFGGTTYGNGGNALTYGTPPLNDPLGQDRDAGDLATHGVFPTLFAEVGFNFTVDQVRDVINVQDNPGTPIVNSPAVANMFYKTFAANMSGLKDGYRLHFDLYNEELKTRPVTDLDVDKFAPFSHDAYAKKINTPEPPKKTPEPATMAGLGLAVGAMAFSRRRKANQTA